MSVASQIDIVHRLERHNLHWAFCVASEWCSDLAMLCFILLGQWIRYVVGLSWMMLMLITMVLLQCLSLFVLTTRLLSGKLGTTWHTTRVVMIW